MRKLEPCSKLETVPRDPAPNAASRLRRGAARDAIELKAAPHRSATCATSRESYHINIDIAVLVVGIDSTTSI